MDQDAPVEEPFEKDITRHISSSKRSRYCYFVLSALFVALAGAAGYLLGTLKSHDQCEAGRLSGTVIQGKTSCLMNSECHLLTFLR